MFYRTKNYQLGENCKILADLYDQNGTFYRTAVVADMRHSGEYAAKLFCEEQNNLSLTD